MNRAQNAYRELGHGALRPAELRTLAATPAAVAALRRRVVALDPPPVAEQLQRSLLRLLRLDEQLGTEVAQFGRYISRVGGVTKGVTAATDEMRSALTRHRQAAPQQLALARYEQRIGSLRERLVALEPPPALRPWHAEQLQRIGLLQKGAEDLRRGLEQRDSALVSAGVQTFQDAADAPPVTRADQAAIRSYNARIRRIDAQIAKLGREQSRLATRLG